MTTTFFAPRVNQTFFLPGSNTPANGAQIFTYAAGTTTKTTVYKDNAALTSWTNPIVLDSGGNLPSQGEIWQLSGTPMKYVFAPANDTDPPTAAYATFDNIAGMNDVTSAASEWIAGPAPTFISATSFSLVGDQTSTFQVGRRVKSTNTAGTVYSYISTSTFTTLTTVVVVNDSGAIDSGLSAVSYGILSATNNSVPATTLHGPYTLLGEPTVRLFDDGATGGPTLFIDRSSASPAAADVLGLLSYFGRNTSATAVNYGGIFGSIDDPTTGSEDGSLNMQAVIAGTMRSRVTVGQGIQVRDASGNGPPGGDKGPGTINTTSTIYQSNVAVATLTGVQSLTATTLQNPQINGTITGNGQFVSTVGVPLNCVMGESTNSFSVNVPSNSNVIVSAIFLTFNAASGDRMLLHSNWSSGSVTSCAQQYQFVAGGSAFVDTATITRTVSGLPVSDVMLAVCKVTTPGTLTAQFKVSHQNTTTVLYAGTHKVWYFGAGS